jgi:hypothetical protein
MRVQWPSLIGTVACINLGMLLALLLLRLALLPDRIHWIESTSTQQSIDYATSLAIVLLTFPSNCLLLLLGGPGYNTDVILLFVWVIPLNAYLWGWFIDHVRRTTPAQPALPRSPTDRQNPVPRSNPYKH